MPATPAAPARPARDHVHQAGTIQRTVELVSPRWHVWILQSLSRGAGKRHADIHKALPMLNPGTLHRRLQELTDARLIERTQHGRGSTYTLSGPGHALGPALDALWDWSRVHRPTRQPTAKAQAIEEALTPLGHAFATDVLLELEHGAAYWSDLLSVLPQGSAAHRLATLEQHSLVKRSGEVGNYRYALTPAARALGPVFDALDDWAHDHLPTVPRPRVSPVKSAALAAHATAQVVSATPATRRAQAANLRPLTSRLVFSHPTEPQPAPLIVTASAARRGR